MDEFPPQSRSWAAAGAKIVAICSFPNYNIIELAGGTRTCGRWSARLMAKGSAGMAPRKGYSNELKRLLLASKEEAVGNWLAGLRSKPLSRIP